MRFDRILINSIFVFITAVFVIVAYQYREHVVDYSPLINEVCSKNFATVHAADYGYYDYVELYNSADTDYVMEGLYLSDDKDEPYLYDMSQILVPAHGYAVIWMINGDDLNNVDLDAFLMEDDDANETDETTLDAYPQYICPFALSIKGEYLYISNKSGRILDSVTIPELTHDVAYGRTVDGAGVFEIMDPTPGESNNNAQRMALEKTDEPALSVASGFYDDPFELEILHTVTSTVYYTLDGSIPTEDSSLYTEPITITDPSDQPNVYSARDDIDVDNYVPEEPVDKAVVIRAIAVDQLTGAASNVVSGTYFVGYEDRDAYSNIAVVSLITDPENLFDYDTGIYVKGATYDAYKDKGGFQEVPSSEVPSYFEDSSGDRYLRYTYTNSENRGREWEREVTVEYYDSNHNLRLIQDAGMRVAGESTRHRLHKSLNLYARDIYGDSEWQYSFWGYDGTQKVRLRACSREDINWRETFVQSLAQERNIGIQRSIPCAVFMDGEYWGMYQLTEQYDEAYFQNHYGVEEDDLVVWKNDSMRYGNDDDMDDYNDLQEIVTSENMASEDLYQYVAAKVDISSLIDYYATLIYLSNIDISATHNQQFWRSSGNDADHRWRYLLYDLDQTCYDATLNTIAIYKDRNDLYWPGYLCANPAFKQQYVTTMMDLANVEYSYQRVRARLAAKATLLQEQAIESKHRYVSADYNVDDYAVDVEEMDAFFRQRRKYIEQYLKEDLGLSDIVQLNIVSSNPNYGAVRVNSSVLIAEDYQVDDSSGMGTWTGNYFSDYAVTLAAAAYDGYVFTGWSGDVESTEAVITIPLDDGDVTIHANYVRAE